MVKRYFIRKPNKRLKSYAIIVQKGEKPSVKTETLDLKAVDSINKNLHAGLIDKVVAEKNLKEIIRKLYAEDGRLIPKDVHNTDNYRVLDEYWKREYEDRDLVDRDTAYHALRRAVDALGDVPILSATASQMQKQVDTYFSGNKQRQIITKLTQLLKFINRTDVKLRKQRPQRYKVLYLTEDEFERVLTKIEDPGLKLLSQVCFYTGCRVGEAFALDGIVNDRVITIASQIDKKGIERDTKNRTVRTTVVVEKAVPIIKRWAKDKINFTVNRSAISKKFKTACRAAFPSDPNKHCKFHDLRHSFAIALLNRGATIHEVASSLGDSARVAEAHYIGFTLNTGSIERLKRLTG